MRSLALAFIAASLLLLRCQCLTAVPEVEDGGADAGRPDAQGTIDAGIACTRSEQCPGTFPPCPTIGGCGCGSFKTCRNGSCLEYSADGCLDGGARDVGRCNLASDCTGSQASVSYCRATGASFSCIDGACLWECGGGRTCRIDSGGCLGCSGGAAPGCPQASCFAPYGSCSPKVEDSTCDNPAVTPPTPFTGAVLTINSFVQPCRKQVFLCGGPQLGTWRELDNFEMLGDFPAFGGRCTGHLLPTGLTRIVWNCPQCQFVIVF